MGIKISFDIACRADQIYKDSEDKDWHIERGYLFKKLLENGLSRIFVGVESGSKGQLLRYNKGYSPEYVISALRYFSLLNIKLRFGFILFDPLMTSEELCENIDFLGRTDVVLSAQNSLTIEQIFDQVYNSHGDFIDLPSKGAVFENVSYMASPLEVLIKSQYLSALKRQDKDLLLGEIDTSFARVITSYRSSEIGIICNVCQSWINFAFPIVYTLKGMRKVSDGETKKLLSIAIKEHRKLSYFLIRTLTQVFQLADEESLNKWEYQQKTPQEIAAIIEDASILLKENNIENAIISVQVGYERLLKNLIKQIDSESCLLEISKKQIWDKVYHNWHTQSIFETKLFRQK
ncbi:hypothetical protein [Anabaena sp. UHCC 0253]|uniref:hypothetical protein n=1 Tax=Anabaena sp. UHCC 0253 TaxID=2590019 RepID=UPI001C2C7499|nr:hypothetical protein [Anabaena sp. UHCC 0253]